MFGKEKERKNLCYFLNVLDISQQDDDGNSPIVEIIGPLKGNDAYEIADKFELKYKGIHYVTRLIIMDAEYSSDKEAVIKRWELEHCIVR